VPIFSYLRLGTRLGEEGISPNVCLQATSDIDIPFFFDKTMHSEPVPMFVDAVLNADTDTGIGHLQTRQRG
jgi:hypothetical protein